MRIVFRCACRQKISVKQKLVGKRVTCPKCSQKALVPEKSTLKVPPEPIAESDSDILPDLSEFQSTYQQSGPSYSGSKKKSFWGSKSSNYKQSSYGSHYKRPSILPLCAVYAGLLQFLFFVYHAAFFVVYGYVVHRGLYELNRLSARELEPSQKMRDLVWSQIGETLLQMMIYGGFAAVLVVASVGLLRSRRYAWFTAIINAGLSVFGLFYSIYLLIDYTEKHYPEKDRFMTDSFHERKLELFYNWLYYHLGTCSFYAIFTIATLVLLLIPPIRKYYAGPK